MIVKLLSNDVYCENQNELGGGGGFLAPLAVH